MSRPGCGRSTRGGCSSAGYSITRTADGAVVRSADAVAAGGMLVTEVANGSIASVVTEITEVTEREREGE